MPKTSLYKDNSYTIYSIAGGGVDKKVYTFLKSLSFFLSLSLSLSIYIYIYISAQ